MHGSIYLNERNDRHLIIKYNNPRLEHQLPRRGFFAKTFVITKHLKNIFDSEELASERVCAKIAHTAEDGKTYNTMFYNLDAIISVGYRVNSIRATQF